MNETWTESINMAFQIAMKQHSFVACPESQDWFCLTYLFFWDDILV